MKKHELKKKLQSCSEDTSTFISGAEAERAVFHFFINFITEFLYFLFTFIEAIATRRVICHLGACEKCKSTGLH